MMGGHGAVARRHIADLIAKRDARLPRDAYLNAIAESAARWCRGAGATADGGATHGLRRGTGCCERRKTMNEYEHRISCG